MKPPSPAFSVTLDQLGDYDEIIDVRSPAEFADDHLPGARNCPVLDDAERARVGTLYKQVSPFAAKKLGAALISAHIAEHLQAHFMDRPKDWKPLIYCWRGGNRSGAMATIFRAIGWRTGQLEGGYQTWRRQVVAELENLPTRFAFRVLCGPTGSAKTRLLHALAKAGEQILDLEGLACHKGSVLGRLPDTVQPSQKFFETSLYQALCRLDPSRPVYVEAESRKIGNLHLPTALIGAVRAGQCCQIEASRAARVAFLLDDYAYFQADPARLIERLQTLHERHGGEVIRQWTALVESGQWPLLVEDLLGRHYDPLYRRSQGGHFAGLSQARQWVVDDLSVATLDKLAQALART